LLYNVSVHATEETPTGPQKPKNKGKFIVWAGVFGLAALLLACFLWFRSETPARNALLSWMPGSAQTVLFVDFRELRRSPFFAELLNWAPKPESDPDYRQFVQDTGFDYEKDLSSVAIAFEQQGGQETFLAMAEGRFDEKKIKAYAAKNGTVKNSGGVGIFSIPDSASRSRIFFTFLHNGRIAVSNRNDFESLLQNAKTRDANAPAEVEWQARFERVAGSPFFSVIRGEALREYFNSPPTSQDLARRATGGLSSPQLSSLLAQLQWVTLAGRPENDKLRVVADGESLDDANAKQLADVLNGIVLLARAGLGSARNQQQIGAATRQSYLALLKSADVSRVETKSVRLMFDVTPALLKSMPSPVSGSMPVNK
jgi:hypothetical protein